MNNIWFLGGTELGQQEKEYQKIRAHVTACIQKQEADAQIYNATFFIGEDDEVLIDEILSSSLFMRYKVITVQGIHKASAAASVKIAQACTNASEEIYLILRGDGHKLHISLERIIPKSHTKIFWKLSDSDYSHYVFEKARDMNINLHPDAVDLIVYLAGEHTYELDMILMSIAQHVAKENEGEKISSHVQTQESYSPSLQKKAIVKKESIEKWITHYKSESVFSLFSMLALHRYEDATDILSTLIQAQENPVSIVAGIVYQIKNALRIQEQCVNGMTVKNACTMLKIRGGYTVYNQYKSFITTLSLSELQDMLCICSTTDAALRDSASARYQQLLVSKMLYDIITIMQKR